MNLVLMISTLLLLNSHIDRHAEFNSHKFPQTLLVLTLKCAKYSNLYLKATFQNNVN